jgi:hypothetical protein
MKVFSVRGIAALIMATSASIGAIAACSSQNASVPVATEPDASGGASMDSTTAENPTDSGGSAAADGGGSTPTTGGSTTDALVTYDGPPPNVDGGQLACATPDALTIKFNPIYSGFDGVHTYQVPVYVVGNDPSTVTWGSTDPTMIDFQPYVRGVMITTKKAGDVTVVARVGSMCGSAPLHIASFTTDEWNIGNARYNNSMPLKLSPEAGIPEDASFDASEFDANIDASAICAMVANMDINFFKGESPACTNCHGAMSNGKLFGMTLFKDIAHTPEQTGGFSEDDLTNAFFNGTIPDGGTFDQTIVPYCIWHKVHLWQDIDTPEKQAGMRAYLRSLTPQEQTGCFDLFNSNVCADGGM